MKNIKAFFQKYFWVSILIIVVAAVIGDVYLTRPNQKPLATPTPVAQTASFKSVVPGISLEADLNKVLGTPVKTTISGSKKTDEYKSSSELRLHSATIEGGRVIFIKEVVSAHDTAIAKSITDVYGNAPNVLYSKFPNSTFNLFAYPSNGIAYLGHTDGTLLEIWYFQPTTLNNLLKTWATDYSLAPSTEILQ